MEPVSADGAGNFTARRRLQCQILGGALVAGLYYVIHPFYFGDAVFYASDLKRPGPLPVDAGHLIWRPLGSGLWRALQWISPGVDPLVALELLASVGTAAACLACFALAQRFGLSRSSALAAAALLGGTHVCLAYGGSGSSYTPAMAMGILAILPLVRPGGEWSARDAAWSCLAMLLAWGFWAVSGLLLGSVFAVAALYSRGPLLRRVLRGGVVSSSALAAIAAVAIASHAIWVHGPGAPEFRAWITESSHGIEPGLWQLAMPRAVYGFVRAFVHFGSFGTAVKGLLLGDPGLVRFEALEGAAFGIAFLMLAGLAAIGLKRGLQASSQTALGVSLVALTAFPPVAAFAISWQGSDVERFSPCVPFVVIALVYGLQLRQWRWRPEWVLALVVLIGNSATLVVPTLVRGGGLPMELANAIRRSMPDYSLLVVTGGDLGANVWAPAIYFSKADIHNLSFDARREGADGWDTRLDALVQRAARRGGEVAVLSDLVGEPTPGGIGLSVREDPRPTIEEVVAYFSDWRQKDRWALDRFTFVELEIPERPATPDS